jgi:hypothetical protein
MSTSREADAHSWAIPRLNGRSKAALVEIQADEYGGGRPDRMHSTIFRQTMRGFGLEDRYGVYIDFVPAITLASMNMMSDAVHEQIAGRDLAGSLAEDSPALLPDIMFGASACITVDGWVAEHILDSWTSGRSSLRELGTDR